MRYEVITQENNYQLRMYNDTLRKVATIVFETEADAITYGEEFLLGENGIDWSVQDDF